MSEQETRTHRYRHRQEGRLTGPFRHRSALRRRHRAARQGTRRLHLRPGLMAQPPRSRARSPTSTATPACSASRLSRSSSSPRRARSSRSAYLLLNGELPNKTQLEEFEHSIRNHTMINESLLRFFGGFHHNAHPMAMVSAVVASMSAFYHDSMDIHNPRHREIFAHRIVAKMPTIAAAAYKHSLGQPFVYPRNDLGYCAQHAAHVLRGALRDVQRRSGGRRGARPAVHPARRSRAERQHVDGAPRGLDGRQSLRRDFRGRVGALGSGAWRRQRSRARDARADRHRRQDPEVPGDGQGQVQPLPADGLRSSRLQELRSAREDHPRRCATRCSRSSASTDNPLFELALRLEEIALKDEYFVARKLYPNVDFYSGIIYTRARHSALDVHGDVRDRAHRGLGGALAGDDLRSRRCASAVRASSTPARRSATTSPSTSAG